MAEDPKQTLKELEESLKSIKEGSKDIVDEFKFSLVDSLQRSIIELDKLNEGFKKGNDITKDINKAFTDITRTQIALGNQSINLEKQLQKAIKAKNKEEEDSLINQLASIKSQQKLNEDVLIQLNTLKNINKEKQKEIGLSNILKASSEKILGTSLSTITSMFTMSGIFALIVDSALQFNKASVASGKLLGYSAEKANEMQSNFISIARSTGDVNITSRSLNEAFNQIAESTGYVAEYSEDALKTQIMLTKQFGLTGEEAAGIYELSVLTGKSSSQVNDEMVGAYVATRNQLKVGVPMKAALAAAAKVSGQLAANLQNNPALITKAVVQASALGTTLEQTASQGEKLLDFSSSIESELKAELLTGKQLNLERARAAALAGDQVTLAQELNKNVGSLEDFQKLNVLQQQSLAEAVGLTADQLADQLKKQKLAQETGKSLAQITKEEALEAEKRQATQDKFNAAILKLQDFFGNLIAGPVGGFLDMITKSLDVITTIATVFGTIYAINKGIALIEGIKYGYAVGSRAMELGKNGILIARQAILSGELTKAIGIAAAYAIANPIQAVIGLALAAGVGALVASQMDDGVIGPGGETVVSGPKGSIKLNKSDSIVAGTDLFGKGKEGGDAITPSIDLTPMISAINEVRSAIDRLYSKDTSVNLDGKKVGTTLTQGSYKVA
jgi:hypothetical protein